jgi:hypothetical protein
MSAKSDPISQLTASPDGVTWLATPGWGRFDWLVNGFSTRKGGVTKTYLDESARSGDAAELNLGFTAHDTQENVRENRARFLEAVTGSLDSSLVALRQVHSCRSLVVDEDLAQAALAEAGSTFSAGEADGLMTTQPGLILGVQTADCIPVLVADTAKRAVAAFHAGWRGTVDRIVEAGVARMTSQFGSDPADMVAAIGPGIGSCCYTVGTEVIDRFHAQFSYAEELFSKDGNTVRLDLIEANRRQLLAAGLGAGSISVVGACTSCHPDLFYSHRASGGHAGRMMAVIGIRQRTGLVAGGSL